MKKILVTGSAGFIGYHLTKALLNLGHYVVGIDNLNDYYDPELKNNRLSNLDNLVKENEISENYQFYKEDLCNTEKLQELFEIHKFDTVVNLAAQAGVRYSLENPQAYVSSNLVGFVNLLECCREYSIEHLVFASSSSVYGMNKKQPFSTDDNTDYPISLYAASKKSNELLAFSYSHLFKFPCTGLRFFTVYGPYGRPDMAYFSFTTAIHEGTTIDIYNQGAMRRDFTYIDDIIDGILKVLAKIPKTKEKEITDAKAPFRIFNIGNNQPVSLNRFIEAIESAMSKKAKKNMLPMQKGDVPSTHADIDELAEEYEFNPSITIEDGIVRFVNWYKDYYIELKN